MSTGLIVDIDRFSTHDGPGIRTTVFLKGCPLSCKWCHSPETQFTGKELLYRQMRCAGCGQCAASCPNGALSLETDEQDAAVVRIDRSKCEKCFLCTKACHYRALYTGGTLYTAEEFVDSIKGDIPFFKNSGGGLTITGGEPLTQADFTLETVRLCREIGIHTIVETCGFGDIGALRRIAEYADTIYFDIKLLSPEAHKEWTGVSNQLILDNLRALCAEDGMGEKILVRVPCIPGVNDSVEHIRDIATFAHSLGISGIQPLPYNPMAGEKYNLLGAAYPLRDSALVPQNTDYMQSLYQVAETVGITVIR